MGRTLSSDSANVIALPASPTGFTAGDYVYRTTAGYGVVPTGAVTTALFDPGATPTPVYSATATTSNELTYVEQLGGSQGSQVAAQLTNGNIVYAYATGNAATYQSPGTVNFRIETTSGTPVVAETSTTMTAYGPFGVSVIALPAGGFAIVSTPTVSSSAYNLTTRFYNADGTVATGVLSAAATITGNTLANSRLKLQSLTDGSIIIGYVNSTTFEFRKVTTAGFDATFGTAGVLSVFSWGAERQWWDFVTDSSNNIQFIGAVSATNMVMRRYNSSGVQQTTSTIASLTGITALAIAISSSGTIRGFAQDATGIVVITWDGTTAAVGTRIITSATPPGSGALGAFAQGASGGYVVFYNAFIAATNAFGLFFQAFDSSNVALATATRVNSAIAVNYRNQFVPIVVSGNTRVYFGVFQANSFGYTSNANVPPMGVVYFAYSNTTYALVGAPTVNYNYGTIGPFAVGAYARGASTPGTAKFTIATTGTYSGTTALGTTLIQKTLVDGTNTTSRLALAPLTNGEFVAVWRSGSSGATLISKYSVNGVLQVGPVSVSANSSTLSSSVATFANGNILVTYNDTTTTTLRFRIYTPSLTVVTSGDIDTSYQSSNNLPVACASFGDGDHIAVLFQDSSSFMQVRCVRSTGTVTSRLGTGLNSTSPWFQAQVIGFKSNSFAIAAFANDGSSQAYGYVVRKTGTTSFLAGTLHSFSTSVTSMSGAPCTSSPIATPGTTGYFIIGGAGSAVYRLVSVNPITNTSGQLSSSETTGTFSGLSLGSIYGATVGYTASGIPVLVANRGTTAFLTLSAFTMPMNGTSTSTSGVTTTLPTAGSVNSVTAIPHVGDAILIGYCDSNSYPAFVSIVVSPTTVNVTLTTGVDASSTGLNLTPENGYSLQGISVTAAASGSNGLVQTRGTAVLNSNYSAATPATFFDFRNPLIFGTNGTVVGRTVTMGNN